MNKNKTNVNKDKIYLKYNYSILTFIIFLLLFNVVFSINLIFLNHHICVIGSSPYTPSPPIGNKTGDINIEYEYIFYTSDVGSSWKFDWGDGNYSDWIKVEKSKNYISQKYSWSSYGIFQVRIKHKSTYGIESSWSIPLIVEIKLPPDIDMDGWKNEIEESYGKDPKNPYNSPVDTDSDGTPDEDSIDGKYIGDLDDDNDGLPDLIEESIGSDSKNSADVILITIKGVNYCLVDINNDGYSDILYNLLTNTQSKTDIEYGKIYLDIDKDGLLDYTYFKGSISKYGELPWFYVIVSIIVVSIAILITLFKTGILYLYEEEYIEEE